MLAALLLFSCCHVWLFVTPWTAARQTALSRTLCQSLLRFMSIESAMLSKHLILCHRLFLLPSIFPSIRVFSNESALLIRWPKYCGLSLSISPSNEYSGLISFRIDWFNLLAVQGTLKSLLQDCNSKASILQCSAFFMAQLSHSYMTTGKATTLNVTSLLFNILPRFVTEQLTPWKSACILGRAECLPLLFPRERFLLYIWI